MSDDTSPIQRSDPSPSSLRSVSVTFETAANAALPAEERIAAFEDTDRARRILAKLGIEMEAIAGSTGTVNDLVFVSPTEANLYGKIVLSDGRWLMTSETACHILGPLLPDVCAGLQVTNHPIEVYARR